MDNMSEPNKKYQIDTAENRKFLEEIRNDLLRFGHRFPSPGGSSYYLGDDGTPGRTAAGRHGSPAAWYMCTAWEPFWDMREARLLWMRD